MAEEKRRFFRWRKYIRVVYAFTHSLSTIDEAGMEAFTEDVSESGLQMLVRSALRKDDMIDVRLEFVYDPVPVESRARVVYSISYETYFQVGVEFVNMESSQKQRLKEYLGRIQDTTQG